MTSISSRYSSFIVETDFSWLPAEVVDQAKRLILDLFGVALAGCKMAEFPRTLAKMMTRLGGKPEATIFQGRIRLPALNAALVNAACSHGLDMDDGHRFAALHPGTVVIPAALAAAELRNASPKDLIAGVVVGYEIMIRLGLAINPSSLNRGFHATGITGPVGAAAAAAKIMGLNHKQIVSALGLAGLQGAGLLQVNHESDGAMVKPINPARAAQSGLMGALLAQDGATAPVEIFEGKDGYLKAFTDIVSEAELMANLGEKFEIQRAYIKFYSACRHAHAAVDAALQALGQGRDLSPDQIQEICVETYPAAIRLAGIPQPTTVAGARFSTQFTIALALIKGDAGADRFCEDTVCDAQIRALTAKVSLKPSPRWEQAYPNQRGATVNILEKSGRELTAEVDLARGEPENPASWQDVRNKFLRNATAVLTQTDATLLAERVAHLEEQSLTEITEMLGARS